MVDVRYEIKNEREDHDKRRVVFEIDKKLVPLFDYVIDREQMRNRREGKSDLRSTVIQNWFNKIVEYGINIERTSDLNGFGDRFPDLLEIGGR